MAPSLFAITAHQPPTNEATVALNANISASCERRFTHV